LKTRWISSAATTGGCRKTRHKGKIAAEFAAAVSSRVWFLTSLFLSVGVACAQSTPNQALLMISIDGMRPDAVLKADAHGLKIPNLRRILKDGAHATGVVGVLPTVTYPSHTTLVTGVWPVKHHIYSNLTFDPLDKNLQGWYWYAEDIAVPTLWEAISKSGRRVGSVSWPVSVGARGIAYNVPEYWRAKTTADDLKLLRALSTPGLVEEIARTAGPYVMDLNAAFAGDIARTKYASYILREKKVQFMTVHLAALDHIEHEAGPFSTEANEALERMDAHVGELEAAARASYPEVVTCVVSDHGFARTDHSLNLMTAFVEEGLVKLDTAAHTRRVTNWKAIPQFDGGSAAIMLKDDKDEATRAKVEKLLHKLAANPANGIAAVLDRKQIAALGGSPEAAFWVDMKPNFSVIAADGPLVRTKKPGGTHGYAPTHPELLASFLIAGPGIRKGLDLGQIDMRSVAPTIAAYFSAKLPTADLKPLPIFDKTR
jgi:predicted AlkP superfamily pyrophosphatase or phosphodiesterase